VASFDVQIFQTESALQSATCCNLVEGHAAAVVLLLLLLLLLQDVPHLLPGC
jgi:hypothetical protein